MTVHPPQLQTKAAIMSPSSIINVTELIDERPPGAFQITIIVLCGLVAILDGFDVLAMGVAAPAMTDMLHIAPKQFGAVFSAALLGLMLGAFGLGPAADRVGRKRVLVFATVTFGVFTICTALAASLHQLLLFRFLAGLGLGGAMPSFIGLAAEYAPRSRRGALIGLLWAGFPVGGAIVGLLASQLIDAFGWQSLFYIGGILPLVLAVVLVRALPESIGFLMTSGAPARSIRDLVIKISPDVDVTLDSQFVVSDDKTPGVPVRHLFTQGRTLGTVSLWASYFAAFLMLVTNATWAPTLLRGAGIDVAQSAIAMAVCALSSVVGTSLAGFLVSRIGAAAVLPAVFVGSALTLGGVGYGAPSVAVVMWLEGLTGFLLGVGSSGLIALAALFYPTTIRSTGVGWSMGIGRFGSFVGPLAVGMLVSWGWQIGSTFAALAAPALWAALFTAMILPGRSRQGGETCGVPVTIGTDTAAPRHGNPRH